MLNKLTDRCPRLPKPSPDFEIQPLRMVENRELAEWNSTPDSNRVRTTLDKQGIY